MIFFKKYSPYFPLFFNILFPVLGILFFDWSVGDIFFLFYVELLFLGGFTCLKMLAAINDGSIMSRIGGILGFLLGFSAIFIFTVVLTGNFFNGAESQMKLNVTRETIYMLLASYSCSFLSSYLFSGKYKTAHAASLRNETFKYMACLFFVMMIILIPFGQMMKNSVISYALGISIVMTRNIVDFFIVRNQEGKLKRGT